MRFRSGLIAGVLIAVAAGAIAVTGGGYPTIARFLSVRTTSLGVNTAAPATAGNIAATANNGSTAQIYAQSFAAASTIALCASATLNLCEPSIPANDTALFGSNTMHFSNGTTDWMTGSTTVIKPLVPTSFTAGPSLSSAVSNFTPEGSSAGWAWANSTGTTDTKLWDCEANTSTDLVCRLINDAQNSSTNWIDVNRTGITVNSVNFPNGTLETGGNAVVAQITATTTPTVSTGCTTTPSITWRFVKTGNTVTMSTDGVSCTSNSVSLFMPATLPSASYEPAHSTFCVFMGQDSGKTGITPIFLSFSPGSTEVDAQLANSTSNQFTASGTKAISNFSCSYSLL